MKAGELNQTMRLDSVGLKDMRSALFHNIPECANDMTGEGAPLADHARVDARQSWQIVDSVRESRTPADSWPDR